MRNAWPYLLLVIINLLSAASQVLLKKAVLKQYGTPLKAYLNPLVLGGYAILFSTTVLNMVAMWYLPYKVVLTFAALSYIFVLIAGRVFFGESVGRRKLAGVAMIVAGIVVFNL